MVLDQADDFFVIMKTISEATGQDFLPDEQGVVTLESADIRVSLESQTTESHIYFHSRIRPLGSDAATDMRMALERNLFAQILPGSWIAIDAETNDLLLCYAAPKAASDSDSVMLAVALIADGVTLLQETFSHVQSGAESIPAARPPLDPEFSLFRA